MNDIALDIIDLQTKYAVGTSNVLRKGVFRRVCLLLKRKRNQLS